MLTIVTTGTMAFWGVVFLRRWPVRSMLMGYGVVLLLSLLAGLNFELGIVEQKFASQFAFEAFRGAASARANQTFLVQAAVNAPAFLLSGVWYGAIGTNCAITAAVFSEVHSNHRHIAWWFLGPAVINFSLFALRDPVIAALLFMLTLELVSNSQRTPGLWYWTVTTALAISRPEVAVVMLGVRVGLFIWQRWTGKLRALGIAALIATALIGLSLAPRAIGFDETTTSPTQAIGAINEVVEGRVSRNSGLDGGGSNILGGAIVEVPQPLRFGVQLLTFVVLPLPFEIRSAELALAFVDSIWLASFVYTIRRKISWEAWILVGCFSLSVAFFATNYGNLLRLRMPLYFIVTAAVLASAGSRWSRIPHNDLEAHTGPKPAQMTYDMGTG